uniref:Uncharacterized protein n=1 Tax=Romanomermis culicivorax TaxID=13658 RepID=A0A915J3C7_ROMCU
MDPLLTLLVFINSSTSPSGVEFSNNLVLSTLFAIRDEIIFIAATADIRITITVTVMSIFQNLTVSRYDAGLNESVLNTFKLSSTGEAIEDSSSEAVVKNSSSSPSFSRSSSLSSMLFFSQ